MKKERKNKRLIFLGLIIVIIILSVIWIWKNNTFWNIQRTASEGNSDVEKIKLDVNDIYIVYLEENDMRYTVEDPMIIKNIVNNLNSLSVKQCDPTEYQKNMARGLMVGVFCNELEEDGTRKGYEFEILGKKKGNYVLSFASYNDIVAEVVEGELDYEYLKEVYEDGEKHRPGDK